MRLHDLVDSVLVIFNTNTADVGRILIDFLKITSKLLI